VKPHLIEEMVRNPNIRSDWIAYKKLKAIIYDFKPDIVHTHASKAGALGRKAAASCGVPIIVHTFHGHVFHSYFGKIKTTIFKLIERRLAKKTDAIIAISEIQKKELTDEHKICARKKVHVIPLGFDLDQFNEKKITQREKTRTAYKIANDEIAIGIIGRLAPIKNHAYFLDIMNDVLPTVNENIKCFIVGDGTERKMIEDRIEKINEDHPNSMVLTSWIKDVGSFNAGMDVICLTSKNEGTPVSLIEAQAGGIPVVTTDVGGVKDIVNEGKTGYIVPIENKKLFMKRLIELVQSEKKRKKMSQNGWNHVQEKFHFKTLVKNMDELYRGLLEIKD
jgi:glycosyltransferase involved in cell wall biosynthesis